MRDDNLYDAFKPANLISKSFNLSEDSDDSDDPDSNDDDDFLID